MSRIRSLQFTGGHTKRCRPPPQTQVRAKVGVRGDQNPFFARGQFDDRFIIGLLEAAVADVHGVVAGLLEHLSQHGREGVVGEEPHAPGARGSSRSRTASAANCSASRTSASSRSG